MFESHLRQPIFLWKKDFLRRVDLICFALFSRLGSLINHVYTHVRQGGVDVHETEPAVKNEYLEDLDRQDRGEPIPPTEVSCHINQITVFWFHF